MIVRFIKNWTLPIAMLSGTLAYFLFAKVSFLADTKPYVLRLAGLLAPMLIFAQLLLTFCKIEIREIRLKKWHLWLLIVQMSFALLLSGYLYYMPPREEFRFVAEGALVCLLCPTATAGAVITAKLGGSAANITTYILLGNFLAAVLVPLLFPLVEPHVGMGFFAAFCKILSKVFPLLLFPFFIACLLKRYAKRVHHWLMLHSDMAFYIWAVALALVSGMTVRSLVNSPVGWQIELYLVFAGLLTCLFQFYIGRKIGRRYSDVITAGQSLGQKNTVFAIWMAVTYLNPLSSIAPGSYVLWQNLINTWQLYLCRKNKEEKK